MPPLCSIPGTPLIGGSYTLEECRRGRSGKAALKSLQVLTSGRRPEHMSATKVATDHQSLSASQVQRAPGSRVAQASASMRAKCGCAKNAAMLFALARAYACRAQRWRT